MSPVMVALVAAAPTVTGVCATPSRYGVTVWLVMALSPSPAAAVHETSAEFVAGRATTAVGGAGTTAVNGVTALELPDCGPGPLAFSASTRNV